MKLENLKLTIVRDVDGHTCTAWLDAFPGLIIQTDIILDVPKQIANSIEVMLKYGMDKGIHTIIEATDLFGENYKER